MSTSVNMLSEKDINRDLKYQHYNSDGLLGETFSGEEPFKGIDLDDTEETPNKIKEFLDNGSKCKVLGSVEMTKVTGQFVFKVMDDQKSVKKLYGKDVGKEIQLNHKINSITFGKTDHFEDIRKTFGKVDNGQHTIFNMFHSESKINDALKISKEPNAQNYYYFLKLVPHVFVDHIELEEQTSYSYSIKHNKKETHHSPELTIILDYAPVKMVLSKV